MNQLRIIDKQENGEYHNQIEIQFVSKEKTSSSQVDYFSSPIDPSFKAQLDWYFKDFLLAPYGKQRKTAQRLVDHISKYGKLMGERLFGNGNIKNPIISRIDEIKLENIIITVESNRPEFFDEPWEIMILPVINQTLATSAAGFIRTIPTSLEPEAQLQVGKENPLNILMVIPRPDEQGENYYQTKACDIFNHLLGYDPAYHVEILYPPTMEALSQRLKENKPPVHILHFDGYASLLPKENDDLYGDLILEDENGQADFQHVTKIGKLLSENNVDIVVLDCLQHIVTASADQEKTVCTDIALGLIQNNVKAVITLPYETYTFSTIQLYQIIYSQLAQGASLGKSMIQARSFMKEHCEQNALTAQKQDFHDWLLPVHFGLQDMTLFSDSQQGVPFVQTKSFTGLMTNLFGFNYEFLPPAEFLGRNPELHTVKRIFHNNKTPIIHGESGIGKTHFIHHLAYYVIADKQFEKAFYFNFKLNPMNKEQILYLIGQILDGEFGDSDMTLDKIKNHNLLLIFDGLETDGYSKELKTFLSEVEKGSSSILIGKRSPDIPDFLANPTLVPLKGLLTQERRQFGVRVLQKNQLKDEEGNSDYLNLLDSLKGHPANTETLLCRLEKTPADELLVEFNQELDLIDSTKAILPKTTLALFELGWKKLSDDFQQILASLAGLNGYISDGLSIAFDMKDENNMAPGDAFFEVLDIKRPYAMSEFFQATVNAGFFLPKPFGKEIRGLTPEYLALKQKEYNWSKDKKDKIDLILKKIYCSELKVLSPFLAQNPNPLLFQKIIENKKRWFKSIEALWNHQEYALYVNSRYLFAGILDRVGLKNEYEEWSFNLASDFDFSKTAPESSPELSIAWLKTASDGLQYKKAMESDSVQEWVAYWESWIKTPESKDDMVFDNTMMFLETYYRLNMDWEARKNLSLIGLTFYKNKKKFDRVIPAMKSVARCEEALGDIKKCSEYEEKILNEIPYERLQEGMKHKAILDIVLCKMNRMAYEEAQHLIDEFKNLPEIKELSKVGEMFQGDLYIKLDRLAEAAAIYSKLWAGIMKREHMVNPEKISKILTDLESGMDKDRFYEIFKENAPGVDTPAESAKKQQEMSQMQQMMPQVC